MGPATSLRSDFDPDQISLWLNRHRWLIVEDGSKAFNLKPRLLRHISTTLVTRLTKVVWMCRDEGSVTAGLRRDPRGFPNKEQFKALS
jgi:hypothetical protein